MQAAEQCLSAGGRLGNEGCFQQREIARFNRQGATASSVIRVLDEEPLSIRIQGKPYAVVMRTPGDEIANAIGFCLGEGIIDDYDDIRQIAFCGDESNVVSVMLSPARLLKIGSILDRRGFISQTSCGICGKEVVADLLQVLHPLQDNILVKPEQLLDCMAGFFSFQTLYVTTRTSHAAAAFSASFRVQAVGEDVGRHNALDKAVGKLVAHGDLSDTRFIVMSSRISYELIQKVARARVPIVLAMSRPTVLAVELAERLGITLACAPDEGTLLVYSGAHRIQTE